MRDAIGISPPVFSWLGRLLFLEVCLLAAIAGILAWRWTGPGLLLFSLILLLDLPRARSFVSARGYVFPLLIAFAIGFVYTGLREPVAPELPPWLASAIPAFQEDGEESRSARYLKIRGKVDEVAAMPGERFRLVLSGIVPDAEQTPGADADSLPQVYAGRVVWTLAHPGPERELPLPGQTVQAKLRFVPVRGFANPGSWNSESYWNDRGVYLRAWNRKSDPPVFRFAEQVDGARQGGPAGVFEEFRYGLALKRSSLHAGFLEALPEGPAAGILPALVFGDRSLLTHGQVDQFARSTLAHSLALSGLHLGFAVMAGYILACGAGKIFPGLWLRISRPRLTLLLALPIAALYIWLGQAPVSLIRAFCMLLFWAVLALLHRQRVLVDGLFAAVACILLYNPLALFDLGLQLSALSVGVIALCLPGLAGFAERMFPMRLAGKTAGFPQPLFRSALVIAGISLCIQIALLPVSLRAFGQAGVLFPLNILWLPVLSMFVLPAAFLGLFAAGAGFGGLAAALLWLASLPCELLLRLLTCLDRNDLLLAPLMPRPHWLSSAGYWLLCLTLPVLILRAWESLVRKGRLDAIPGATVSARRGRVGIIRSLKDFFAHMGQYRARPEKSRLTAATRSGAVAVRLLGPAWLVLPVLIGAILLLLPVADAWLELQKPSVRLRLLDVGQGQAALVEWTGLGPEKQHGRVLVDGGGFASDSFDVGKAVIAPVLTDNALPRLDAIINSHPDADHLSGLLFILQTFHVDSYFGNGDKASPSLLVREEAIIHRRGIVQKTLAAGDTLGLAPGLWLEVVWPPPGAVGSGEQPGLGKTDGGKRNNASLVLRLVWQGKGLALLCGDAEKPALRELVRGCSASEAERGSGSATTKNTAHMCALQAEVLVLPHHGAAGSLYPALYDAVRPSSALAACGFANRWGYPARSVRTALQERGIRLHSTAAGGQITVRWSEPGGEARYDFALDHPAK